MHARKNKYKNKFDLTVSKTRDEEKLVVLCIRDTNVVIKKYKNSVENKLH